MIYQRFKKNKKNLRIQKINPCSSQNRKNNLIEINKKISMNKIKKTKKNQVNPGEFYRPELIF